MNSLCHFFIHQCPISESMDGDIDDTHTKQGAKTDTVINNGIQVYFTVVVYDSEKN